MTVTNLGKIGSVVDHSALSNVTKELKSYTPPSLVHHYIISVLLLHITGERWYNNLDGELTERLREDLPV